MSAPARLHLPIGRFLPVASPVHARDPRLKLLVLLAYVAALFAISGWNGIALLAAGLAAVTALSRIPFSYLWRGLRPLLFLILLTFVFQAVSYPGEGLLWEWGPFVVSKEGLQEGAFLSLRLVLLLAAGTVLTLSTAPMSLTDGVEWLLRPLRLVRLSSQEMALMMVIALRFIPTVVQEFGDLMVAQQARGIRLNARNPRKLAQALLPLVVPLFARSFRRADELAVAMAGRCYRGGEGRTRFRALEFGRWDAVAAAGVLLWLGGAVLWDRW